jgi:hypothetical protein
VGRLAEARSALKDRIRAARVIWQRWVGLVGLLLSVVMWLMTLAFAVTSFALIVWGFGKILYGTSDRQDSYFANGIVVDGESGVSALDSYYCVEYVEFRDHRGQPRRAKRACDTDPVIGESVMVRYAAADPAVSSVVDDYMEDPGLFWGLVLLVTYGYLFLLFILHLCSGPSAPRGPSRVECATRPLSAEEEFRRLEPIRW